MTNLRRTTKNYDSERDMMAGRRGVVVTRLIQSAKLLYAGLG